MLSFLEYLQIDEAKAEVPPMAPDGTGDHEFEDPGFDRDTVDDYLGGKCDFLAIALHRKTKLPINAMFITLDGEDILMHAFVSPGKGKGVDVKGLRSIAAIEKDLAPNIKDLTRMGGKNLRIEEVTPLDRRLGGALPYAPNMIDGAMYLANKIVKK